MCASIVVVFGLLAVLPTFAFVITPHISRQERIINRLTYSTHSKSIESRTNAMSCLFSQQSSSVSIENTNQTDTAGSNLMESLHHHSSPDDIVAMMTSNALEDETDPLFLSYASQVSTTEAPAMKNDIGSNQIIELSTDESSLHGSTPNNEPLREPSKINKNTLEPHIYHFNKMLIDTVYNIICTLYPTPKADAASTTGPVHADQISQKCFARFYVLETVARVPYFAYLSVLHLRETLGERVYSSSPTLGDASDMNNSRLRTHYAEADNELHHLLIMESLGGNTNPVDRAIAQCMAMGYYWYVVLVYTTISPQAAYHLSELIEDHAYHTYDDFLNMYEKELKQLPVPPIAKQYYMDDNSYLQDLCRTVRDTATTTFKDPANGISHPKPILNSLYDVFVCVRDDEKEHWKTLCHLVQYDHMTAVTTTVDNVTTTVPVQSTEPATTMTTFPWQILKYP